MRLVPEILRVFPADLAVKKQRLQQCQALLAAALLTRPLQESVL